MSLRIRDTNSPPPERFHFPIKGTGVVIDAGNYNQLFENVRVHCASNNVQPPSDQEIIDYLCVHTHVSCYDSDTKIPLANKLTRGEAYTPPTCCGRGKK